MFMRHDELLTTGDVAKMIGRSARTVSRLVKDGDIPYAERLSAANGIYLIRRSAVIAYLAKPSEPKRSNQYRDATKCVRGHKFTPENTFVRKDGRRMCRECARQRDAARKQRAKEEAA